MNGHKVCPLLVIKLVCMNINLSFLNHRHALPVIMKLNPQMRKSRHLTSQKVQYFTFLLKQCVCKNVIINSRSFLFFSDPAMGTGALTYCCYTAPSTCGQAYFSDGLLTQPQGIHGQSGQSSEHRDGRPCLEGKEQSSSWRQMRMPHWYWQNDGMRQGHFRMHQNISRFRCVSRHTLRASEWL